MAPQHPVPERQSCRARWLFPIDREPIENGTIEITAGRISAIHRRHHPGARDLGNVAIIPALVNAHTHLEFSDLSKPLEPADCFSDWIQAVVRCRRARQTDGRTRVAQGRRESAAAGTGAMGEIVTDEASLPAFDGHGPMVCAFRELIGYLPQQFDEQFQIATKFLTAADDDSAAPMTRGLSPHAPYSVHPELFARLIDLAARHKANLAVHLAETREELEFLDCGTGPIIEQLQKFGVPSAGFIPRGTRPLDYLQLMSKIDRALVVHGNYLSADEISYLAARPNLTTVYCPRTHAYFGHGPHPWQELLARGASVAIGTDSRASNPDLSLWRELCSLKAQFPRVEPATLLKLGTIAGAHALDLPMADWSMAVEGVANLAVMSLTSAVGNDPYAALFDVRSTVVAAMANGVWLDVFNQ